MTTDPWVEMALTDDSLVAKLLVRMKHSVSVSDSFTTNQLIKSKTTTATLLPPRWGHKKSRSKATALTTTTAAVTTNGFGKEKEKEHRGSPTTHLQWSGGGGSTSDGYDDSSRPSDLSSGSRSLKANANEASTSSYNKSHKRKSFIDLKDEECTLLKERKHINKVVLNDQELTSMRVSMNQQVAKSENLKRIKINLVHSGEKSRKVEAETKGAERGGIMLPDLNMLPANYDEIWS